MTSFSKFRFHISLDLYLDVIVTTLQTPRVWNWLHQPFYKPDPLIWRCHIHWDVPAVQTSKQLLILHKPLVPDHRNPHSEAALCLSGPASGSSSFSLSCSDTNQHPVPCSGLGILPAWNMLSSVIHLSFTLALWFGSGIICYRLSGGQSFPSLTTLC